MVIAVTFTDVAHAGDAGEALVLAVAVAVAVAVVIRVSS